MFYESIEAVEETPRHTLTKTQLVAMVLLVTVLNFVVAMTAMAEEQADTVAAQTTTKAEDSSVFRYQPGPVISYGSDNDIRNAGDTDQQAVVTSTTIWLKSPYLRQYKLSAGARFSGNLSYADGTPEAEQTSDVKFKFGAIRAGVGLFESASTSVSLSADARLYQTGILDSLWQSFLSVTYTDGPFSAEFYPGIYSRYDRIDSAGAYLETILTYRLNETIGFALYSSEDHTLSLETGDQLEGLFGPALVYNIAPALSGLIVVGNDFAVEDGETVVKIRLEGAL